MNPAKIILPAFLAVTMVGATAYTARAAGMEGKMGMMEDCGILDRSDMMPMMRHMVMGSIHPGMIKHIKGQLKPEQIAQFDAALKDYNKKIEPIQQSLFVKHQELKALQHAANPDVKAVSKTATEFVQLFSKLKSEREAFEEKIKKDFDLKELHGDMMGGMMGGGMMNGGMMGGMKHDAMNPAPPAAEQTPAGHEGHNQ